VASRILFVSQTNNIIELPMKLNFYV